MKFLSSITLFPGGRATRLLKVVENFPIKLANSIETEIRFVRNYIKNRHFLILSPN